MNLTEAFQALDKLDEEVFSVTDTDLSKLQDFMTSDDSIDEVDIFNLDAECDCEEESHEGETVLDCCVCHSKLLKPVEEVIVDEESELVNKGEECPYCFSTEGYKVVGEIKSTKDNTIEVEESLKESTSIPFKSVKTGTVFRLAKDWKYDLVDNFYTYDHWDNEEQAKDFLKKHAELVKGRWVVFPKGTQFKLTWMRGNAATVQVKDFNLELPLSLDDFDEEVESGIFDFDDSSIVTEAVDLSTKDNTIASVLKDNMDKLYSITNPNELRNAIIEIVDDSNIADKPAVQKLKRDLFSKKSVSALLSTIATYMTGDKVIKTNKRGKMTEAATDNLGTDIDKYQKWVDYDMKRYHKISNKTNNYIRKAGLQVVKDKYGDYQVIAGKYDIDETINESNSTKKSDKNESLNETSNDRIQKLLSIIDNSFEVLEDAPINEDVLEEAKQIRLSSIPGVTRDPSNDFSDDGNRFQAYLYKGIVPITYSRADGDVYITIAFHDLDNINYEEYHEFPSYMYADDFNGVSVEEFDPQVFKKNLDAAYEDVTMFLGNVKEVDPQQLEDRIKAINNACKEYEEKVKQYIKDNALDIIKLTDYQFKRLKEYVTRSATRTADAIRDASASSQRAFMSDDVEKLKERISSSWNFKYIEELINSVKESLEGYTQLKLFDDDMVHDIDVLYRWSPEEVEPILVKHGSDMNNDNWIEGLDLSAAYAELMSMFKSKYADDDEIDYEVAKVLGFDESLKESTSMSRKQMINYLERRYSKRENADRIEDILSHILGSDDLPDDDPKEGMWANFTDEQLRDAINSYEGYRKVSLKESVKDVTITTDDSKTTVTSEDDGKVSVTTEPIKNTDETDEVIAPVSEETEREIDINSIDKNSINEVTEKCLKENFNNITFFRTNNVTRNTNAFVVEGVIGLKSGKKHNTRFLFESSMTDNNKVSFSGKNRTLKDKSLSLIGTVDKNNKLISESLTISNASNDVKGV